MPYSAKAVANKFLELAQQDNMQLTQMQIQKLVYISHGFHLALTTTPLIDEPVQAWQYGPVISSLYDEFRGFGNQPITSEATITIIDDNFNVNSIIPRINDEQTTQLINAVWNKYNVYSGPNLSDLTHKAGTPWSTTLQFNNFFSTIDNKVIQDYYANLLAG
jgi:uncharacterized phage-associated protein